MDAQRCSQQDFGYTVKPADMNPFMGKDKIQGGWGLFQALFWEQDDRTENAIGQRCVDTIVLADCNIPAQLMGRKPFIYKLILYR